MLFVIDAFSMFRPESWFPTRDEAPFPDTPAVHALQALLDCESTPDCDPEPLVDGLLAAAEAEGLLDDDPEDPWLGLVALDARQREAVRAFQAVADLNGVTNLVHHKQGGL